METNKPNTSSSKPQTQTTVMKDGRRPISSRAKPPEIMSDDLFGNSLALSPEELADLDRRGLVPRWVDGPRLQQMQGHHARGWRLYRKEIKPSDTINSTEFKFGTDPTGVIRRGSLVLAVKTKDEADRHRTFLNQRVLKQSKASEDAANALRAFAKRAGLNAEIHEGYEENDAPGI